MEKAADGTNVDGRLFDGDTEDEPGWATLGVEITVVVVFVVETTSDDDIDGKNGVGSMEASSGSV